MPFQIEHQTLFKFIHRCGCAGIWSSSFKPTKNQIKKTPEYNTHALIGRRVFFVIRLDIIYRYHSTALLKCMHKTRKREKKLTFCVSLWVVFYSSLLSFLVQYVQLSTRQPFILLFFSHSLSIFRKKCIII